MRLILCDPSLQSVSGHCLGYLLAVKEAVTSAAEVYLVGNRGMSTEFSAEYSILPGFTHWIDARVCVDPRQNRNIHEEIIISDLKEISEKLRISNQDVILINSLRQWGLRGVLRWLEQRADHERPMVYLILHFSAYTVPEVKAAWADLYKDFFQALEVSSAQSHIKLFADSESLVSEYHEFGSFPVKCIPIPHVPDFSAYQKGGAPSVLNVTYMGAARTDKGFMMLPHLVKLINSAVGIPPVEFQIMSWCDSPKEYWYRAAMSVLTSYDNVHLYNQPLNQSEYESLLVKSDVGLLLYRSGAYFKQTSGVLPEFVAAKTVVVTCRGTWIAEQTKQFGLGKLVSSDDPLDVGQGLLDVICNFEEYMQKAVHGRMNFLGYHNKRNFANILQGNV